MIDDEIRALLPEGRVRDSWERAVGERDEARRELVVAIHDFEVTATLLNGEIARQVRRVEQAESRAHRMMLALTRCEEGRARQRAALRAVLDFWECDPLAFGDDASVTTLAGRLAAVADLCRAALAGREG